MIAHVLFAAFSPLCLKKRHHARVARVREYLETVRDFDELISPQSLFLLFLGLEPSNHVWKNIEIVKKWMMTRFSKTKLADIQEKKAKASLTSGHLTRKCQRDAEPPKDDPAVTSPIAKSVPQRPASPTSSLKLIASTGGASKAKKKDKASSGSFWVDVRVAMLKALELDRQGSFKGRDSRDRSGGEVQDLYEYSKKLCDYNVKGFELFRKYLAKHHPELDFTNFDMEAVKKEVLFDRQFAKGVKEGGEMAIVNGVIRIDLSSSILA
nr:hypothetical protein CFP56_68217 [Quercus suber]